jgi:hypothetical protein
VKITYVSIFAIVLVLLSGMPLISGGAMNPVYAKYASTKTQSQTNTNNCNNGSNCAITSPQTQGNGNLINPFGIQSDLPPKQIPPQVSPDFGVLKIVKIVNCPRGFEDVCPKPEDFRLLTIFSVTIDTMESHFFVLTPGSSEGNELLIPELLLPASYIVREGENPPVPAGLALVQFSSTDCRDTLSPNEQKTCTFTNDYRVAPTSSTS